MSTTMPAGYGMPRVEIAYLNGELIRYLDGRPLSYEVEEFEYEYDEEGDDKGKITIADLNGVKLADHRVATTGTLLLIRWGYAEHDRKVWATRRVVVRDIKTSYNTEGVRVTLILSNSSSYLRAIRAKDAAVTNIMGFINDMSRERDLFKINGHIVRVAHKPGEVQPDATVSMGTDATGVAMLKWFNLDVMWTTAGKGPFQTLRQVLDETPGGPYLIDGRDDTIDIHPRNFNQKAIRAYKFAKEPGDIIDFTVETNEQETDAATLLSDEFDPDEKEVSVGERSSADAPDGLEETAFGKNTQGNSDTNGSYKYQLRRYMLALQAIHNYNLQHPDTPMEPPEFTVFISTASTGYYESNGASVTFKTAIESTAVQIKGKIPASVVITSPEGLETIEDLMGNTEKDLAQKHVTASLEVIGDPRLESSKVIIINNVASVHAGYWYIVKATHTISKNTGYTTTLEVIKPPEFQGSGCTNYTRIALAKLGFQQGEMTIQELDDILEEARREREKKELEDLLLYTSWGDAANTQHRGIYDQVQDNKDNWENRTPENDQSEKPASQVPTIFTPEQIQQTLPGYTPYTSPENQ